MNTINEETMQAEIEELKSALKEIKKECADDVTQCVHCDDYAETVDAYDDPSCFPCAYDSAN